jgi:hypothetical protein
MWETISQIGSGLTLIAFIVAAVVALMRQRLLHRERQLAAAPEGDRGTVIQALNDSFLVPSLPVDPSTLTAEQQYMLLLQQIRDRSRRYLIASVVVVTLGVLIAAVTAVAISRRNEPDHPPRRAAIATATSAALPPRAASSSVSPLIRQVRAPAMVGSLREPTSGAKPGATSEPKVVAEQRSPTQEEAPVLRRSIGAREAVIEPAQKPWSNDEATSFGFDIAYAPEGTETYSVLLQIAASFEDATFDTPASLSGIENLAVSLLSPQFDASDYYIRVHTRPSEGHQPIRWGAELVLNQRPVSPIKLQLMFGSRSVVAVFLDMPPWIASNYKFGPTSRKWHRVQGDIEFTLAAPDWPIIDMARMLPGTGGSGGVIELLVSNYSDLPLQLTRLNIQAFHPRLTNPLCMGSDPLQEVILNWRVIARTTKDPPHQPAASTDIGGVDVQVPTVFRGRGKCSDYSFSAAVPLVNIVRGRERVRLFLVVNEMPESPPARDGSVIRLFGIETSGPVIAGVPESLYAWDSVSVGLEADHAFVYPRVVALERRAVNEKF